MRGVADIDAFAEIGAGDFLERQEAVAVFAVADETGFEGGLDAGDDAFVDIGLALFASGGFDIDVDQFLTVDDRDAQFFLLRSVKQHAFHFYNSATREAVFSAAAPCHRGGEKYRDVREEGSAGGRVCRDARRSSAYAPRPYRAR